LPEKFDEDDLMKVFSKYGTVLTCQVKQQEARKERCFGFVNFVLPEMVVKAITE